MLTIKLTVAEARAIANRIYGDDLVSAQDKVWEAINAEEERETPFIVATLREAAEGLDFQQADHREMFRLKMEWDFRNCSVKALRQYVRDLKDYTDDKLGGGIGQSRADVLRNLIGRFILLRQLGEI